MHRSVIAAALTVAAGAFTVAIAAGPANASVPACQASQLEPHYAGRDGTAGTFHDSWHVLNLLGTCQLSGWVSVQNFTPQGNPMPMRLHQVGGPAHAVDIRNGQHATFTISFTDPGVTGCTPEHPINMTIALPGNHGELLAGRGEAACSGSLRITPFTRGG
jgi:hypothetical protein